MLIFDGPICPSRRPTLSDVNAEFCKKHQKWWQCSVSTDLQGILSGNPSLSDGNAQFRRTLSSIRLCLMAMLSFARTIRNDGNAQFRQTSKESYPAIRLCLMAMLSFDRPFPKSDFVWWQCWVSPDPSEMMAMLSFDSPNIIFYYYYYWLNLII